jgi:hypothetical protein
MLKFLNIFWFMLQVDPIQSYLNLKIGLPPVLKAGSSGMYVLNEKNLNALWVPAILQAFEVDLFWRF